MSLEYRGASGVPDHPESTHESKYEGGLGGSEARREQGEFKSNEIIVPDDEISRAEELLPGAGIAYTSRQTAWREDLNAEGTAWRPGEFLLTLTRQQDSQPLNDAEMLQVLGLLQTDDRPVTARLARDKRETA